MDSYRDKANASMLKSACAKMLHERCNVIMKETDLDSLLSRVSAEVENEYAGMRLKISELNNITLTKMKNTYQQESKHIADPIQRPIEQNKDTIPKPKEQYLDDDMMNHKLKELETRRQVIPTYAEDTQEQHKEAQDTVYKSNPISITIPPSVNDRPNYKSFIINSLNRDWCKFPKRNTIKFTMSLDVERFTFYPHCICFPKFVKTITPYVIIDISDGTKNVMYTLTCGKVLENWDTWYPIDCVEKIGLKKNVWTVKMYDFTNNELDLGSDAISVVEVSKRDGTFVLKAHGIGDCSLKRGDRIHIRCFNGNIITRNIESYDDEKKEMSIVSNDLLAEDFINSKLLVLKDQLSLIVKYDNTSLMK